MLADNATSIRNARRIEKLPAGITFERPIAVLDEIEARPFGRGQRECEIARRVLCGARSRNSTSAQQSSSSFDIGSLKRNM